MAGWWLMGGGGGDSGRDGGGGGGSEGKGYVSLDIYGVIEEVDGDSREPLNVMWRTARREGKGRGQRGRENGKGGRKEGVNGWKEGEGYGGREMSLSYGD